jgi:hypothetical protein
MKQWEIWTCDFSDAGPHPVLRPLATLWHPLGMAFNVDEPAHRRRITVTSGAGKGSGFSVTLPPTVADTREASR